jgi:hypothetical protein
MGYLTAFGELLTYNEYKEKIPLYKKHGINQFLAIYNTHKDRRIEENNLHWGEEVEYSVYYFNRFNGTLQLFNDAYNFIKEFN